MNMLRNPTIIMTVWKVLGISLLIVAAFILVIDLVQGSVRSLVDLGGAAKLFFILAVHHRDVGTGCTRSRLTGKTKATSFRLSTTVGRLCFGHYDIFSLTLGQYARADAIPFYTKSPGYFLHLQKRCDTDNPRICYCGF